MAKGISHLIQFLLEGIEQFAHIPLTEEQVSSTKKLPQSVCNHVNQNIVFYTQQGILCSHTNETIS